MPRQVSLLQLALAGVLRPPAGGAPAVMRLEAVEHWAPQARTAAPLDAWCASEDAKRCEVCLYCLPVPRGDTGKCAACAACDAFAPCFVAQFSQDACAAPAPAQCQRDCGRCVGRVGCHADAEGCGADCDSCEACLSQYPACLLEAVLTGVDDGADRVEQDMQEHGADQHLEPRLGALKFLDSVPLDQGFRSLLDVADGRYDALFDPNNSVVVVGNGDVDGDWGESVDAYDVVVRFNEYGTDVRKYGSKVDIHVVNLATHTPNGLGGGGLEEVLNWGHLHKIDGVLTLLAECENFEDNYKSVLTRPNLAAVNKHVFGELCRDGPSRGFLAVALLRKLFRDVSLLGFGGESNVWTHITEAHAPNAEHVVFERLIADGDQTPEGRGRLHAVRRSLCTQDLQQEYGCAKCATCMQAWRRGDSAEGCAECLPCLPFASCTPPEPTRLRGIRQETSNVAR